MKAKPKIAKFEVGDLVVINFDGEDNENAGWTRLNGEIAEVTEPERVRKFKAGPIDSPGTVPVKAAVYEVKCSVGYIYIDRDHLILHKRPALKPPKIDYRYLFKPCEPHFADWMRDLTGDRPAP